MMNVHQKANIFLKALVDAFEDEDHKSTEENPKIPVEDMNEEDLLAVLLAAWYMFDPEVEFDLVDFTHVLNREAVDYTMAITCEDCDICEDCEALANLAVATPTITQ
jgi:hypothetical protein